MSQSNMLAMLGNAVGAQSGFRQRSQQQALTDMLKIAADETGATGGSGPESKEAPKASAKVPSKAPCKAAPKAITIPAPAPSQQLATFSLPGLQSPPPPSGATPGQTDAPKAKAKARARSAIADQPSKATGATPAEPKKGGRGRPPENGVQEVDTMEVA